MAAVTVKITDVAKAAGVSQSTASFVLSGRGDEMHISKETQELVWKVSKELGYRPSNLSRRMRKSRTAGVPTVTIFWSVDRNFTNLARAFMAMQNCIIHKELNIQIVLKPFLAGSLSDVLKKTAVNYFNGAIIGGASVEDLKEISGMELKMPIVFFERNIPNFNSVYTNTDIGSLLAPRMKEKEIDSCAILFPPEMGPSMAERYEKLQREFKKQGIKVRGIMANSATSYLESGKEATKRALLGKYPPKLLFYLHEETAIGGIDALRELGLQGGRDIEVAAYASGSTLDYLGMPITRFRPPFRKLVENTVDLLIEQIEDSTKGPQNIAIGCEYTFAGKLK